jgi:hypothetical protein
MPRSWRSCCARTCSRRRGSRRHLPGPGRRHRHPGQRHPAQQGRRPVRGIHPERPADPGAESDPGIRPRSTARQLITKRGGAGPQIIEGAVPAGQQMYVVTLLRTRADGQQCSCTTGIAGVMTQELPAEAMRRHWPCRPQSVAEGSDLGRYSSRWHGTLTMPTPLTVTRRRPCQSDLRALAWEKYRPVTSTDRGPAPVRVLRPRALR